MVVERPVAQIQPDDVDAGIDQLAERLGRVARRPDGRHDLRSSGSFLLVYRAMELLIIRHALPVRRELTTGAADPELSEAGLRAG